MASAQPKDPAAADSLFQAGRTAATAGNWTEACARFTESQRLDPAPGTAFNLADCHDHLGHIAQAWQFYRVVVDQLPADDERVTVSKEKIASLDARVPRLTLKAPATAPRGLSVRRDDVDIGSASIGVPLAVDPGVHVIEVSAPGREVKRTTITLSEGEAREETIELGPMLPRKSSAPSPAPVGQPPQGQRTAGLVIGGFGVASILTGAITGGLTVAKKSIVDDHCDHSKACDSEGLDAAHAGKTLGPLTTVALGVGAAALTTGIVLIATSPSGSRSAPRTSLTTHIGAGLGSIELSREF